MIGLLRAYLRPYHRTVALVLALVLAQSLANLYLPNLNADLINDGVARGNIGAIWTVGAEMLAVATLLGAVAIVAVYFASQTSMGAGRDLRAAIFEHVLRFSTMEMSRFGTPTLITRTTNDVQQLQVFLQMGLTVMVAAPVLAVGGVVMALNENVTLSGLLAVIVPVTGVVLAALLYVAVPLFRAMQLRVDRINQVLREQITGVRVIRAFIRTRYEERRFEGANAELTATALRVNRLFALAMPTLMAIMNLSSVAVLWFGGRLVDSGAMPIGNLTAFLSYLLQILQAMLTAMMMAILIPRALASAERIQAVLETVPSIADPPSPKAPAVATGGVEFRAVGFGYPGGERPVLTDVSLGLAPGEMTAIIGGTGAGKTTLLNLIPRFVEVSSGAVLVDGVDVREQTLARLRSRIGLVPQRAYLFSGTVADNLRFGNPAASDGKLWRALTVAQARDFVAAMPGQLQARIDQGGTNVSGGQRQRLAIARALVKRPAIYLFDDCFSALDATTDALLRRALRAEVRQATMLLVAQRVSTILDADRIVVLDQGRIVGVGRHDALLASCATYRAIVESQLGEAMVA